MTAPSSIDLGTLRVLERLEAEASVICRPDTICTAEQRLQPITYIVKVFLTVTRRQCGHKTTGEGLEKTRHVTGQTRRTRNDLNVRYGKSCLRQAASVILGGCKVPGVRGPAVVAASLEFRNERRLNRLAALGA